MIEWVWVLVYFGINSILASMVITHMMKASDDYTYKYWLLLLLWLFGLPMMIFLAPLQVGEWLSKRDMNRIKKLNQNMPLSEPAKRAARASMKVKE